MKLKQKEQFAAGGPHDTHTLQPCTSAPAPLLPEDRHADRGRGGSWVKEEDSMREV